MSENMKELSLDEMDKVAGGKKNKKPTVEEALEYLVTQHPCGWCYSRDKANYEVSVVSSSQLCVHCLHCKRRYLSFIK